MARRGMMMMNVMSNGGSSLAKAAVTASMRLRSGMGVPLGTTPPPDKPLHMEHELIWDDGSAFPEPALDRIAAPMVGKYEALAWLCGGLSFFGLVGALAVWNDKASKVPFTPREYPFDNLRVELGGDPDVPRKN